MDLASESAHFSTTAQVVFRETLSNQGSTNPISEAEIDQLSWFEADYALIVIRRVFGTI